MCERAGGVFLDPHQQILDSDFDCFMMRVDPPITDGYRCAIQLITMDLENRGRDPERCLVNPPSVLLGHNDKLLALAIPDLAPRSIISSDLDEIAAFVESMGTAVLKPVHNHQSKGVVMIDAKSAFRSMLLDSTARGTNQVVVQEFLSGYRESEKRVWMLDGEVMATCLKCFQGTTFPPELALEEYVEASILTEPERAICKRLGSALSARHVRMAGVDIVDGYITDVNVVSPGLLVEIEHLDSSDYSDRIIAAIDKSQ